MYTQTPNDVIRSSKPECCEKENWFKPTTT